MVRHFATVVVSFVLFACGGGQQAPHAPGPHGEHGHGHGHGHGRDAEGKDHKDEDHGKMSPALKDFHHVLAPAWHETPGEARIKKTCDTSQALADKAAATGDAELVSGVAAVTKACGEAGRAQVESTLSKVHDRFHALTEKH